MNKEQSGITGSAQTGTVKALQYALKMEIDGQKYYLDSSRRSINEIGKELFQKLSVDEAKHARKFREIYQAVSQKQEWPAVKIPAKTRNITTIFNRKAKLDSNTKISASPQEFDAIDAALDMENRSRKYYEEQSRTAAYPAESEFYQELVVEERGHYLALTDYREYLSDPAGWFTNKEHPTLDGA